MHFLKWRFYWRVSGCEELVWDEIQLPVQSVIRTFLEKKLWRPESLFPGNCMDKLLLNADKNADKMDFEKTLNCKSLLLFTEMDASLVVPRTSNPYYFCNISDLSKKYVLTIEAKWLICVQFMASRFKFHN